MSLKRCFDLILSYQKTKDRAVFYTLLAKFDMLLLSVLYRLRKQYKELEDEPMQALYHSAVIAFGKALVSTKESEGPDKVPARIVAYVKAEIRCEYRYKRREILIDSDSVDWIAAVESQKDSWKQSKEYDSFICANDIRVMIASDLLTDDERMCLIEHFYHNETKQGIANQNAMTRDQVRYRIKKALEKLKAVFSRSRDNYE